MFLSMLSCRAENIAITIVGTAKTTANVKRQPIFGAASKSFPERERIEARYPLPSIALIKFSTSTFSGSVACALSVAKFIVALTPGIAFKLLSVYLRVPNSRHLL